MNLGEIRSMARTWLNEPTASFWTDAELNRFIDYGSKKLDRTIITLDRNMMLPSVTFTTTANTKAYGLPTDFQSMVRLEHYVASDVSDIDKIDEIRFPRVEGQGEWPVSSTGKPSRYFIRDKQIEFLPCPDDAYTIRLYYNKLQTAMTVDTDIPPSPSDFHDMIALWAVILALPKNGDSPDHFVGLYKEREKDLSEALVGRDGGDPMYVEGYLEGMF